MKKWHVLALTVRIWTLLMPGQAPGQVTLVLQQVPGSTTDTDTLFLAGNLNNWNPRSKAHAFHKKADQRYYLTLPQAGGERSTLEFKITRGSWDKGEVLKNGADRGNRTYMLSSTPDSVYLEVENWADDFERPANKHTAARNVQVISQNFEMPQLNNTRRVWLYLPPGYASSKKRYPVLYMHDGQNLFDSFYSFSGEWGVDETLNRLSKEKGLNVIVVGVDNGGEERLNEYSPWKNDRYGGGKGEAYVDFLVQTLKPYIDTHYRTLPGRSHTGIAGSSMGGLISLYAAAKYPEVFGKAGVFSPALWFSPKIYGYIGQKKFSPSFKLYLIAGGKEGEEMVAGVKSLRDLLRERGLSQRQLFYKVHPDGEHNERFWQQEFGEVVSWLFTR